MVGGSTSEAFISVIQDLIEQHGLNLLQNWVLVVDNAQIHKSALVKTVIEKMNLNLIYLPPYSPFLNPCENCFSVIKGKLARQTFHDNNEIFAAITEASKLLTREKVLNMVLGCQRRYIDCLNRIDM
jgi:transposase